MGLGSPCLMTLPSTRHGVSPGLAHVSVSRFTQQSLCVSDIYSCCGLHCILNFSRVISGVGGSRVCSRRGGFHWGGGALQKEEGWCAENFCFSKTPPPFGVAHHSLKDSQTHLEVCPEMIPNPVKLTTKIRHAKGYRWEPSSPPLRGA